MEVFLYNSTVCRLCGEENDNGNLLYSNEENGQNLSEIINTYLPIKISDDGHLPRTICPGCTIQLEASVEFLNLIINGQKVIRELYQREKEYKKSYSAANEPEVITEKIVYEINTSDGVYQIEHPIALQVAGLEKPKRKRGRPPKKQKNPEDLVHKDAQEKSKNEGNDSDGTTGKRRRKTPTRFKEVVQGKELERIFKEEGMTDGEDSDTEKKVSAEQSTKPGETKEPQVIGHLEKSGELVVILKGRGRGRPRGRLRQTREQCMICGTVFSSVGRYMSHIAQHGPVLYQCTQCNETFSTRLLFCDHQKEAGHVGQNILQCKDITPAGDQSSSKTAITVKETEKCDEKLTPDINTLTIINLEGNPRTSPPREVPAEPQPGLTPAQEDNNTEDIRQEDPLQIDPKTESGESPKENERGDEASGGEGTVPVGKIKTKLKCNHCNKMFSSKQSRSLHNKAVHQGEKPFKCGECGAAFGYPRSLALHRISHRRHKPAKGYACDLCGKVLSHPSSVVYHKQAAHSDQHYVCGTCGKHFRHKQLLLRHQLVHSQLRPYKCKMCDASFKTKANLVNHQMLHSGVKKFSCELCKHKFAHKTSLTLHMRWHTGVKPYECNMCGKTFSQKGNLSEHERIHTGEKPYQCVLCPRRFTTSSQHRLHMRRCTADRAPCQYCNARFPSRGWSNGARGRGRGAGGRSHCAACGRSQPDRTPHKLARKTVTQHEKAMSQTSKQISLLVSESEQAGAAAQSESAGELEPDLGEDEDVVYIAYDVEESDEALRIFDRPDELYSGSSLLVPPSELELPDHLEAAPREHLRVIDEHGNPLHFTMQDGTRLAITSADGQSLQVVTHDGQTIPVEINTFEEGEQLVGPDTVVHQLNLQKGADDKGTSLGHYYTLV